MPPEVFWILPVEAQFFELLQGKCDRLELPVPQLQKLNLKLGHILDVIFAK